MASIDQIELPNGQVYDLTPRNVNPYWNDTNLYVTNVNYTSTLLGYELKTNKWAQDTTSTNSVASLKMTENGYLFRDSNGRASGRLQNYAKSDGTVTTGIRAYNMMSDGVQTAVDFEVICNKDGTASYNMSSPENLRQAISAAKDTSWVEVNHKAGTTAISVPSDAEEICCLVVINNTTIAWTFILPYVALSTTSYRYVNGYPSFSDGYIAVNVSKAQVSLNSVYSGQSNVTNNSILYLYARK